MDDMQKLVQNLRADTAAERIRARRKGKMANLGLVNHYRKHELIPNKWFDWERRQDAPVMIIGQDWGPYVELEKYVDSYQQRYQEPGFNYDQFLFETFSSRTENFIIKAIRTTSPQKGMTDVALFDNFIFTMAVLFTRQGEHFRGNHNFDPTASATHSYPYVARQIDIVQPKVIVPLGSLALGVVERYFGLELPGKNLTQVISSLGEDVIDTNQTVIIPNFHPASHTDPKVQLKNWEKIWQFI